jgi:hypothetical protein
MRAGKKKQLWRRSFGKRIERTAAGGSVRCTVYESSRRERRFSIRSRRRS